MQNTWNNLDTSNDHLINCPLSLKEIKISLHRSVLGGMDRIDSAALLLSVE